jgi:hypothetical protein
MERGNHLSLITCKCEGANCLMIASVIAASIGPVNVVAVEASRAVESVAIVGDDVAIVGVVDVPPTECCFVSSDMMMGVINCRL